MVVGSSEQFVNSCDHLTDYTFVRTTTPFLIAERPLLPDQQLDGTTQYSHGYLLAPYFHRQSHAFPLTPVLILWYELYRL